jgi:hypothetical protein
MKNPFYNPNKIPKRAQKFQKNSFKLLTIFRQFHSPDPNNRKILSLKKFRNFYSTLARSQR